MSNGTSGSRPEFLPQLDAMGGPSALIAHPLRRLASAAVIIHTCDKVLRNTSVVLAHA